MKYLLLGIAILYTTLSFSQSPDEGYFFGGFESNSQWLLYDKGLNFEQPDDAYRANNYFQLSYAFKNFTAGVQYESYLPDALLGYSTAFSNGNGVATYYFNYKNEKVDVTGGYFYDQFGSGLVFRAWEERQLGINNAIRGVRVKYNPTDYLDFTALYGQQRIGFELSEGTLQGLDANIDISQGLSIESIDIKMGASYVARYQDVGAQLELPSNVNVVGGRLDVVKGNFYGGLELASKSKDALFFEGQLVSPKLYDGTALQLNVGYGQKGLGINGTFRRLENFNFYSDRLAEGNIYNQQTISYTPALTKQQDYLLTNIYVYSAQPRLVINALENRSGEVGSQTDFYYTFKKDSFLGKYKSKIAVNFSYWAAIESNFNQDQSYDVEFIGDGNRYYRDFNFELKNRWSNKFNTTITMLDVIIDKGVALGGPLGVQGDIKAKVGVIEGTYRYENGKSSRAVIQHLWTRDDKKNWAGLVYEYNFSTSLNVFIADGWNYGGTDKIHYYNIGGSYSKDNIRLSLNYGRQRGGLICVGGVCRYVPENTGLNLNLNLVF